MLRQAQLPFDGLSYRCFGRLSFDGLSYRCFGRLSFGGLSYRCFGRLSYRQAQLRQAQLPKIKH